MSNTGPSTTTPVFTATRFDTADAKAKVAAQLIKFIDSGYPRNKFTKRLYNALTHMFGHIAHFDTDGFYHEWFSTPKRQAAFLHDALSASCVGNPHHTWSDVETYIQEWIRASNLLEREQANHNKLVENSERTQLAYLLNKYKEGES